MELPDNRHISFVFFGSGPVAADSLELLLQSFTVEAVITKPSTVSEMTVVAGSIPVHAVSTKKELDALIEKSQFTTKLGVLIDFGIIVSQYVIDSFAFGIVNSHFSILPELRGADPISFAILSGQEITGVSSMLLVEAMDEGPLLGYGEQPIDPDETTATLTTKLIGLSYGLLLHNLAKVHEQNGLPGVSQSVTGKQISYSRKLTKADGVIDWTKPAIELEREVRAFIEWPKSRTVLGGKDIILTRAHTTPEKIANTKPGDLRIMDDTNELGIITADGILWIDNLKPAGKKEMPIRAFLAGYRQLLQD